MNFRPKTLDQFVGQDHFKERMETAIQACLIRNRPFPHFLMDGPPGLGKTTMAEIVNKELTQTFYCFNAATLTSCKFLKDIADWKTVVEPWLVRNQLVERTPQGRVITDTGRRHLEAIQGGTRCGYKIITPKNRG